MSDSESDRGFSRVGGSARVGGGGDHDDGGGPDKNRKNFEKGKMVKHRRRGGHGCGNDIKKAKDVVLFPLSKAKKHLIQYRKTKSNNRVSLTSSASANITSSSSSSSSFSGKTVNGGSCFCFKQLSATLDSSPAESDISDPNDPKFTFEMLKTLIEKNDFYSQECNSHLDVSDVHHLPSFNDDNG